MERPLLIRECLTGNTPHLARVFCQLSDGLRHDSNPTKLGLMDCAGLADAYLIGMSEGPNFDAAMERRFQEYVDHLGGVVGNDARRRASLRHRIARMIMHKLDRCPYCAQSYIACQKPNDNTLHKML
jgi:hypothetical protein